VSLCQAGCSLRCRSFRKHLPGCLTIAFAAAAPSIARLCSIPPVRVVPAQGHRFVPRLGHLLCRQDLFVRSGTRSVENSSPRHAAFIPLSTSAVHATLLLVAALPFVALQLIVPCLWCNAAVRGCAVCCAVAARQPLIVVLLFVSAICRVGSDHVTA
jgi:hypothetical protein